MTAAEDLPESLYAKLNAHISTLLGAVAQRTDEQSLASAQAMAREKLQGIEHALTKAIDELRRNAEHNTFTVAFYGETNAGKSTLIETLRIRLDESTKSEQREHFRTLQQQAGLSEDALNALEVEIQALASRLAQSESDKTTVQGCHDQSQAELDLQERALRTQIEEQKRNAGLIQRILNLLRKLPEEIALAELQASTVVISAQREDELATLHLQGLEVSAMLDSTRQQHQTALNHLHQLSEFEDGSIIGDGRADFTRQTQAYRFKVGGQEFQLLDVPGIEGDERKVSEEINNAVKCAHAVFYVTAKAGPPQTGDAGRPGTLQKIKAQLGAQTEVWTLYNKRITNPMALQKAALVSSDEQTSLDDLDRIMREQFGDHYQSNITLCALPAFYATAECLVPRSTQAASRKKFLDALPADALLEKSRVEHFIQRLTQDLVSDVKVKIRRSNLNKLDVAIEDVRKAVKALQTEQFAPLARKLTEESESAGHQLTMAVNALNSRLLNCGEQAIGEFEDAVRNRVYKRIDSDISNDDFKNALARALDDEQKKLQERLPEALDKQVEKFQQQVGEIVERFQEHAKDLLTSYAQLGKARLAGNFSVNANIDNGINLLGLLASVAGGALMIWNPMGWVMMSIGVLTLLTGMVKAVKEFFSSDYKKGQQRKATDENLDMACEAIREGFRKTVEQALPPLTDKVEQIQQMLLQPARQARQINQTLDVANLGLKKMASDLKA